MNFATSVIGLGLSVTLAESLQSFARALYSQSQRAVSMALVQLK